MVFEVFGVVKPWHRFSIYTSRLLIVQRFVEVIFDAIKEALPHFSGMFVHGWIVPLNKRQVTVRSLAFSYS